MTIPKELKLTYFNIKGLAEPSRLAMFIGGIKFEDERMDHEQFKSIKESLPFKQLPILKIDNTNIIAQSGAILRYVGTLAHLYPQDPFHAALVDQIMAHLYDFSAALRVTYPIQDVKEKIAARQQIAEKQFLPMLKCLEDVLVTYGGEYSVGNMFTIADIYIYCQIQTFQSGFLDGIPVTIADGFPKIMEIVNKVKNDPRVVQWEKEHFQ